ncbi:MAG: tRNA lysidine(34) synthetase TilS [Cyclobacteriaceae bacterium]|nr:tRNA lysidine(34) synthetase TilS [Cyclobacteriaceae bacterium]
MKEKLREYVQSLGVTTDDKILLAVSGGVDSMVMAHLFSQLKYSVVIAHVNFRLRGAESDADQQFVEQWCKQNRVPFFTAHFETNNYATTRGLSIQMAARELRYQWFNELVSEHQLKFIATAHHINDSLETSLLNLARGAGLEGLLGIAPQSGNRIRPLMFATRAQVEAYAAENEIAWREDSSNQTDAYQRNLIRHRVIPELKKINPALESAFVSMSEKIRHDLDLLTEDVKAWQAHYVMPKGESLVIQKAGIVSSLDLQRLWRTLRNYGFNREQMEAIRNASSGQPGKVFYSATHCLAVDRETLIVSRLAEALQAVSIPLASGKYRLGSLEMNVEAPVSPELVRDASVAVLDMEKLAPALIWRGWQAGDYFFPLGMTQRKKISDFLVDEKVPVGFKNQVTVLESNGEIVWVAGYRIDNRFKLTKITREAALFRLTQL